MGALAGTLHISEAVITAGLLQQRHGDEGEVQVGAAAVITPTGWDYIRDHRLRVARGHSAPPSRPPAAPARQSGGASGSTQIREVQPPAADDTSIRSQGRCDYPEQPFGCKTDEFGSGFAGSGGAPQTEEEFEALVQSITDHIMTRLNGS